MFVIACILSVAIIWIFKGRLSEAEPGGGQQTLELGVLAVRSMLEDIVGPHGLKYFPVVMTFAVLILVSNLMGLFPLFMSPTSATSVPSLWASVHFFITTTSALAKTDCSKHLKHFAGPVWWIAPLIFPIELISNFIRRFRLAYVCSVTCLQTKRCLKQSLIWRHHGHWFAPILLMPLSVFVAFIQTFVFILLSQLYLSEVSHPPHVAHGDHEHATMEDDQLIAPVLTYWL